MRLIFLKSHTVSVEHIGRGRRMLSIPWFALVMKDRWIYLLPLVYCCCVRLLTSLFLWLDVSIRRKLKSNSNRRLWRIESEFRLNFVMNNFIRLCFVLIGIFTILGMTTKGNFSFFLVHVVGDCERWGLTVEEALSVCQCWELTWNYFWIATTLYSSFVY